MLLLNTDFSADEKDTLNIFVQRYNMEIQIIYSIVPEKLNGIEKPNRMILAGGLYLCEEKDELQTWNMGQFFNGRYDFWGNYGDLNSALAGL